MKKVSLCLLALLLVIFCAGCNSDNGSGGGKSPAATVLGNSGELIGKEALAPKDTDRKIGFQLEAPEKGEEIAIVTMKSGETFKLRFFPEEAPKAVYNFKLHAIQGYFDNQVFHRVMENFMIQGGDPEATGRGGESVWGSAFEDEFHSNLLNIDGAVAMANSGANTNGSQFFINATNGVAPRWDSYQQGFEVYQSNPEAFTAMYGRWIKMDQVSDEMKKLYNEHGGSPYLDGYYSTTGEGHTVFAQVFEGMDDVYKLSQVEVTLSSSGELSKPVKELVIESIKIVKYE